MKFPIIWVGYQYQIDTQVSCQITHQDDTGSNEIKELPNMGKTQAMKLPTHRAWLGNWDPMEKHLP
jgi:hypothetical protein